jgi:hypothetical protein
MAIPCDPGFFDDLRILDCGNDSELAIALGFLRTVPSDFLGWIVDANCDSRDM